MSAKGKQSHVTHTTPEIKPVASIVGEVLATPTAMHTQGMPEVIPNAQPAPPVIQPSAFDADANKAADAIVAAAQGRLAAWQAYAETVTDPAGLEIAQKALQAALSRKGYARAQQEASDWKAYAILYHYDKSAALRVTSPDRTVPKMKGDTVVKDANGAIIRVRPTPDQIMADIRAERDRLAKASIIPESIYRPKAKPTKTSEAQKLSADAFDKVAESFNRMSADQFGSLWVRFLAHAASRADGDSFTKVMLDQLTDERIKRGWQKAPARVLPE